MKLTVKDGWVRFEVHARPRASRSRITAVREGALVVSLAAPPVDGAANEELVAVLADALGVPRRAVVLARGETSKTKLVDVQLAGDLTEAEVRRRLEAGAGESKSR